MKMEKKIRNLFVATGVIAGAAVSLVPLTSYAAESTGWCQADVDSNGNQVKYDVSAYGSGEIAQGYACDKAVSHPATTNVGFEVEPMISIDAVSNNKVINLSPSSLGEGGFTATISANTPYTVSLSSDDNRMINKAATGSNNDQTPAFIPASANPTAGVSGWGIKGGNLTSYQALTDQLVKYYDSGTERALNGQNTDFQVAVGAAAGLPQGTYLTMVKITAASKGITANS